MCRLFSEELSWCLGGVVGACAAVWLYLDVGGFFLKYGIFIVSIIYGAANSLLLITRYTANLRKDRLNLTKITGRILLPIVLTLRTSMEE